MNCEGLNKLINIFHKNGIYLFFIKYNIYLINYIIKNNLNNIIIFKKFLILKKSIYKFLKSIYNTYYRNNYYIYIDNIDKN